MTDSLNVLKITVRSLPSLAKDYPKNRHFTRLSRRQVPCVRSSIWVNPVFILGVIIQILIFFLSGSGEDCMPQQKFYEH